MHHEPVRDFTDPAKEELHEIASKYELYESSVEDCLQPDHLPKHENVGSYTFVKSGLCICKSMICRLFCLFIGSRFLHHRINKSVGEREHLKELKKLDVLVRFVKEVLGMELIGVRVW